MHLLLLLHLNLHKVNHPLVVQAAQAAQAAQVAQVVQVLVQQEQHQ